MILLNDLLIECTLFPDNTSQVWKIKDLEKVRSAFIKWQFSHESEFMRIAQLKTLLDSLDIDSVLWIEYLPYARQDKDIGNDTTFALHSFARALNFLQFKEVVIIDPHSKRALDLIKNSYAVYPVEQVRKAISQTQSNLLCYPDLGALTKYTEPYKCLNISYIYAEKSRDKDTGEISLCHLIGEPIGKRVLIVDDICDGGATFIILAQKLLDRGAKSVNLFVTYGLFSRGLNVLRSAGIRRIFTLNGEIKKEINNL